MRIVNKIQKILIAVIPWLSIPIFCYAQKSQLFIEHDIKELKNLSETYGMESKEYNDKLLDCAFTYSDTCYHAYYAHFANAISDNNYNLRKVYGIDDINYRQAMIALNNYFLLGRYVDREFSSYEERSANTLMQLEDLLNSVSDNKEEFLNILCGMYRYYKKDSIKSMRYAKKRLDIAYTNRTKSPTNYAYALSFYIQALSDCNLIKKSNKELQKFTALEELLDEDKILVWDIITRSLNTYSPDDLWLLLVRKHFENGHKMSGILVTLNQLAQYNKVELMKKLDSSCFSLCTPLDRIQLYQLWGSYVGNEGGNWEDAAHFNFKAIILADSIGRSDLNFSKLRDGSYLNQWEVLSNNYSHLGNHELEIQAQENAVSSIENYLGKQSYEWLHAARHLASLYSNWIADYDKSIHIQEEVICQLESKFGKNYRKTIDHSISLVGSYRLASKQQEAISLGNSLLKNDSLIRSDKRQIFNLLGLCHNELSEWEAASYFYKQALEYTDSMPDKLSIKTNLAGLYGDIGLFEEQGILLKEIKQEVNKYGTPNEKFSIHESLGLAAYNDKDALEFYNEAERWMTESITPNRIILHYRNKATRCSSRYDKMLNIEQAINIYYNTNQQDSILLGVLLTATGDLYADAMDYIKADDMYIQALQCMKDLPYTDERLLSLLNNAAVNLNSMSEYSRCNKLYSIVARIRKETLGTSHPTYHLSLRNLFGSYLDLNDCIRADSVISEYKYAIQNKSSKSDKLNVSLMQSSLSLAKGQYGGTLQYLSEALAQCSTENERLLVRRLLKSAYKGQQEWGKYIPIALEEIQTTKRNIVEEYFQLTQEERKRQSFYLNNLFDELMEDIDLDQSFINEAFDFSLFSKGLLFKTQKEFNKVIAKDADKYNKYVQLKDLYNEAVTVGDSIKANNILERIGWVEREVSNTIKRTQKLQSTLIVEAKDVLKYLPKGALAINFVKYKKDSTFYYGAFQISHKNPCASFIELCSETDLVQQLEYDNNGDLYSSKLKRYFENINNAGLYKYVWEKLSSSMACFKDIYFCGIGLFDAIPIEYLKDENRVIVADKYNLHRVFSLTDIKEPITVENKVIAFGVADHNSPINGLGVNARGSFSDLPEVKIELDSIAQALRPNNDITFMAKLDDEAREVDIKNISGQNANTLHLSSHAFYLSSEMMENAANDINANDHYAAVRFLKAGKTDCSAIVLRKGNLMWHLPYISESEDGILTSDEVENLNFPNLKLTVLSACQTGKGQTDIEGVWGLQRAFRIAGTSSLICTTRLVNSKYAEEFMTMIYRELANRKTVYEAFTTTRQHLYSKYKSNYSKWTSFILIE